MTDNSVVVDWVRARLALGGQRLDHITQMEQTDSQPRMIVGQTQNPAAPGPVSTIPHQAGGHSAGLPARNSCAAAQMDGS